MAWLSGWQYRKSHVINSASGAGTNYQIKIKVHYGSGSDSGEDVYLNGHCKTDFGDIRFTKDDGTTLLDYWMEEKTDSDYAIFWVEIADDLSSSNVTIYIYYGKSDATTTSNGDDTFLFFDDFEGTELDTNKWTKTGTGDVTVSGGICQVIGGGGTAEEIDSVTFGGSGQPLRFRSRHKYSHYESQCYEHAGLRIDADNYPAIYSSYSAEKRFASKKDGTYSYTSYSSDPLVYHDWEIRWKSGSAVLDIDDGTETVTKTDNIPEPNSAYLMYQADKDSSDYIIYIDWCFVAKYVDPEPSHGSWGNEEQSQLSSSCPETISLEDKLKKTSQVLKLEISSIQVLLNLGFLLIEHLATGFFEPDHFDQSSFEVGSFRTSKIETKKKEVVSLTSLASILFKRVLVSPLSFQVLTLKGTLKSFHEDLSFSVILKKFYEKIVTKGMYLFSQLYKASKSFKSLIEPLIVLGLLSKTSKKKIPSSVLFVEDLRKQIKRIHLSTLSLLGVLRKKSLHSTFISLKFSDLLFRKTWFKKTLTEIVAFFGVSSKDFEGSILETLSLVSLKSIVSKKTLQEVSGLIGSLFSQAQFLRTKLESLTLVPQVSKASSFFRSIFESLVLNDLSKYLVSVLLKTSMTLTCQMSSIVRKLRKISLNLFEVFSSEAIWIRTYSEALSLEDALQMLKGLVKTFYESLLLQETLTKVAGFSRDLYQTISLVEFPKVLYKKVISEANSLLEKSQSQTFKLFTVSFSLKSSLIRKVSSLQTEIFDLASTLEREIRFVRILLEELALVDSISKSLVLIFKAFESLSLESFLEITTFIRRKFAEVLFLTKSLGQTIFKVTFEPLKGTDLLKEKVSKEIKELLCFVFILRKKLVFSKLELLTLKDILVKETSRVCLATLIISSIIKSSRTQLKVLSAKLNLFDLVSRKITALEVSLQETIFLISFCVISVSKKIEEAINLASQILQVSIPFVRKFIAEILLKRYFTRILKRKFLAKVNELEKKVRTK